MPRAFWWSWGGGAYERGTPVTPKRKRRHVKLAGCIMLTPEALALFVRKAGRNLLELDLVGCQVTSICVYLSEINTHMVCIYLKNATVRR